MAEMTNTWPFQRSRLTMLLVSFSRVASSSKSALLRTNQRIYWMTPRARKDRKSTRLNSSHSQISYAVFCLKKKKKKKKKIKYQKKKKKKKKCKKRKYKNAKIRDINKERKIKKNKRIKE